MTISVTTNRLPAKFPAIGPKAATYTIDVYSSESKVTGSGEEYCMYMLYKMALAYSDPKFASSFQQL